MSYTRQSDYEMRDAVMQILSDDEVARLSATERVARLADGDEYIDMAAPENGVRCVHGALQQTMGQVLPRSAVSTETWAKIGTRFGTRFAKRRA